MAGQENAWQNSGKEARAMVEPTAAKEIVGKSERKES